MAGSTVPVPATRCAQRARRRALVVALAVSVTCGWCSLASAQQNRAEDYAALLKQRKRVARRGHEAQRAVTLAFARDERVRISDRLRGLSLLKSPREVDRLEDELLGAYLFTVARNERARSRRLGRALAIAKKLDDARVPSIVRVRTADAQYARAQRMLKARAVAVSGARDGRAPPLSPDESLLQSALYDALKHYEKIGDALRRGQVAFLLARFLELSDAPRDAVLRAYTPLLRAAGSTRGGALLRQQVRLARARVLMTMGKYREAAHESLVADHMRVVPVDIADFDAPEERQYERSELTEALCRDVYARAGIDCATIQKEQMDRVTFFDYTRGSRRNDIDVSLADRVWEEYRVLVQTCRQTHASLQTQLRMSWSVQQTGHVDEVTLSIPPLENEGELRTCLQDALNTFRYPRHSGAPWRETRSFP